MANMQKEKTPMPVQAPEIRNHNFKEVAEGYTLEMAKNEADRCLNCKNKPCISGCPVNVEIPDFIMAIKEGNILKAADILKTTNALPAVCGRVCPQETQCEAKCVRGIKGEPVAIGRLERFAADYLLENGETKVEEIKSNGHKVAIVGSGPSALSCAGDLVKLGYDITVFEAFHTAGGVLVYGIPEFRLPKKIVEAEIKALSAMGVKIVCNMVIGKVLSVDELFEMGFEAVFIGTGAGLPNFMNIEGENLLGVYSANEYLTRTNLMKAYLPEYDTSIISAKNVAVVGGGNVAMDAARCAKRMGATNVSIIYRRSLEEMPARVEEIHHAKEEGIDFYMLHNPTKINGDEIGRVNSITCIQMELGEPDESGRRRPVTIAGSEKDIPVDCVIIAIGNSPNPLIRTTTKGIEANKWGCLVVNEETLQTTREGVYAGGDAVTGAATVILAMGAGKVAANSIDEFISRKL